MKQKKHCRGFFVFSSVFTLKFALILAVNPWMITIAQEIRPYDGNPRYWQYKDEPVLLLGGTDTDAIFFWDEESLIFHLDLLVSSGGNYIRNVMSSRRPDVEYPFMLLENNRYDLDQWNMEYWYRLERLLAETSKRDIIVQIELWDGHDYQSGGNREVNFPQWAVNPFNPLNNINFDLDQTTLPPKWKYGYHTSPHPFFETIPELNNDQVVLHYQKKFIDKLLDHTLKYGNVLYVIQNESWSDELWSDFWLEYIRNVAEINGNVVHIGDMRFQPTANPVLEYGFDFVEMSQSASGVGTGGPEYRNHQGKGHFMTIAKQWWRLEEIPLPMNSVKQYGGDEVGWSLGADEGIDRVWRSVFAGQAAVRFHRPPHGIGLNERARMQLKSLRKITDIIEITRVQPHQKVEHLISNCKKNEAYLMADPGRIYTVYFTDGGTVQLDVSDLESDSYVKWIDTEKGEWVFSEILTGNNINLTPPSPGKWAVVISGYE